MAAIPAEIHVIADLECELDGQPVSIRTADRRTVVEVPDLATGLKLIRLGSPRGYFFAALRKLKRISDAALHSFESRVRGETVGLIGYGVGSQGWRVFGLPALALNPVVLATEMARRHRD